MLKKYAPTLWIVGGMLLMLPSLVGNGRSELIPVGIVFVIIGISQKMKKP